MLSSLASQPLHARGWLARLCVVFKVAMAIQSFAMTQGGGREGRAKIGVVNS